MRKYFCDFCGKEGVEQQGSLWIGVRVRSFKCCNKCYDNIFEKVIKNFKNERI